MNNNDAVLGTAITSALASTDNGASCPSMEALSELIDGSLAAGPRDDLLGHLAVCDRCRNLFLTASELVQAEPAAVKRRGHALPSAFAAAAVLVIALSLRLHEPVPGTGPAAQSVTPAPMTARTEVPTPEKEIHPSAPKVIAVADVSPAPGAARLSWALVRGTDAKQLAPLLCDQAKTFGFAAKGDGRNTAFRIGVNLMDLEVALRVEDGERAQAQATRLAPLLESIAGTPDTGAVEALVDKIERGDKPSRLAGSGGELEKLIPKEHVAFARLGAWAEGARLAALSENRRYLAAGVPRYFPVGAEKEALPASAAAALRGLDRKLKKRDIDFEAVEKDVAALLASF